MAAIDFPNSPTLNQEFTSGDRTWIWDSVRWLSKGTIVGADGADGIDGIYTPSDTPPENPVNGQPWLNTANGNLFIYWDNSWIQAVGATGATGVLSANNPLSYNATSKTISVLSSPTFAGSLSAPSQPMITGSLTNTTTTNGFANYFYPITNTGMTIGVDRITVPVAGNYLVNFNTITNLTTATRQDTQIYFNGTNQVSALSEDNGTGYHYRSASIVRTLSANDYIQFSSVNWYSNTLTGYVDWRTFSITKLS